MENLVAMKAFVSDGCQRYALDNFGAGYPVPARNGSRSVMIDDLNLWACDLIQLDVEGFEHKALKGAEHTIRRFRPTIVLEEKDLPHLDGPKTMARSWLSQFGYQEVDRVHRDVIFAW